MRKALMSVVLLVPALAMPMVVGCEREVESEKTVDVKDDGTVVKQEEKVTENADGSVTKTETKDVNKPNE